MSNKDDNETDVTHPAYGLLQISRITGNPGPLFGSSIDHQNSIRVRVNRCRTRRSLYRTSYFDEGQSIVEVEMSANQFAEAITSLNIGSGVPCTIRYIEGVRQPQPEFEGTRKVVEKEFAAKMAGLTTGFKTMIKGAEELLNKKSLTKEDRKNVLDILLRMHAEVCGNIPFMQESFNEAIDKTITEAKAEVESFVTNAIMKAGQEAIASRLETVVPEAPRLRLE